MTRLPSVCLDETLHEAESMESLFTIDGGPRAATMAEVRLVGAMPAARVMVGCVGGHGSER